METEDAGINVERFFFLSVEVGKFNNIACVY